MANDSRGTVEASLIGFGFGTFFGGGVLGAGLDLLGSPVHSMATYVAGALLGGLAGLVAGRVAGSVLL